MSEFSRHRNESQSSLGNIEGLNMNAKTARVPPIDSALLDEDVSFGAVYSPAKGGAKTFSTLEARQIDPSELSRSHFLFGRTLGEGSYARVVHAEMKIENSIDFAVKIMEKAFIQKEDKVDPCDSDHINACNDSSSLLFFILSQVKFVLMEKEILSSVDHEFIVK